MGAVGWQQARGIRGEVLVGVLVGVLVLVVVLVELEGQGPGRAPCPHHLGATLGIQVARVQVLADQVLLCGRGGGEGCSVCRHRDSLLGPGGLAFPPGLEPLPPRALMSAEVRVPHSRLGPSPGPWPPTPRPGQAPTLTREGVSG